MIRLLLLLCAGLFVMLKLGGEDRGQLRFGLLEAQRKASERATAPVVDETMTRAADPVPVMPTPGAAIVPIGFTSATPIVVPHQPIQAPAAQTGLQTVKYVQGRSVNVRAGPSTQNAVIGRLTRGEAVTVVSIEDNGWARVRLEGDGIDGFMSLSFLAETAP